MNGINTGGLAEPKSDGSGHGPTIWVPARDTAPPRKSTNMLRMTAAPVRYLIRSVRPQSWGEISPAAKEFCGSGVSWLMATPNPSNQQEAGRDPARGVAAAAPVAGIAAHAQPVGQRVARGQALVAVGDACGVDRHH